jgi:large-conductance mechanosensitive channel
MSIITLAIGLVLGAVFNKPILRLISYVMLRIKGDKGGDTPSRY